MFESIADEGCSNVSSLCKDLSNLVTWAHTHGTICIHIPALETKQNMGQPSKDNSVLWICGAGHAYHWTCEDLHFGNKNEAAEKRKRQTSLGAPSQGAALGEKRIRIASSFERARRDSGATGSRGTPAGSSQQKDTICKMCNEPPARENQRNSKPMQPGSAAEQHLSISTGKIRTDLHEIKLEYSECISEDDYAVNAENQEEIIDLDSLSQSLPKDVAAEVGLQMYPDQKTEINKQTATSTSGLTPVTAPHPTLCCILKSPGRDLKILKSCFVSLGPLNPIEFASENSRAGDSAGSATAKEDLELIPISNTEAEAQLKPPASVPSSSESNGSGTLDLNGNATEGPAEESRLSGAEQTPRPSTSLSQESRNDSQPPESSKTNKLSNRNRNAANIKIFRDWLHVHCPSEAREIYELPPKDLDNYMVLFFTSAKKQNGMDFSTGSLQYFQNSIDRYLKDYSYECSVVKGSEFRASQEALKQRCQLLSQRERDEKWSLLEKLTDENVDHLRRGFEIPPIGSGTERGSSRREQAGGKSCNAPDPSGVTRGPQAALQLYPTHKLHQVR
ncbi:uncharacterized protein KIAA1958 homolog isoform X2 [Coturnix japonica]|uniref:uncharacterized protein KIAA1958 homolog isoform X2 n=1 Tax=Coturnix japonica TaxID=93934 RepID=UPI000777B1B2|nr:uncharacterized protein KIAA1958 homolog isoform X2 [Coturnix japonica]